ncbi:DUF4238 domain-containing protein [Lysobacter capsici]|uniref:DUF4238 domain-containing protein n=1 Tax=Lysobacter capsici TaxID=435897 RepID=UPI00287BA0EA|nr:DUF4238 domain-containing protein [Lysobacter capsici]WND81118.1 DUF4238 domain-containing protein [Lysobacter capsici]WND86314.1 DUF4238 domain-containing protein [Lysobacter capsici]
MGSQNITKRCHWVPKAYLRAFCIEDSKTKIWRLGKDQGCPEIKDIEKVAVRFHLYVPRDAQGRRDDAMERKLADLEQWFSCPLWDALAHDVVDLAWGPARKMISLLAATMFLRNPSHWVLTQRIRAQLIERFSDHDGQPAAIEIDGNVVRLDADSWPTYKNASEDEIKRIWIDDINGAAKYAEIFMKMRWSMLCSTEAVFITTDNPITFLHPSGEFRGVNNVDSSVLFPISPKRLLVFDNLMSEPANQYYQLQECAAPQNALLWRHAMAHIFSHRHPDEVYAEISDFAERIGF